MTAATEEGVSQHGSFGPIPSSEAAIQESLGRQPGDSPRGNGPRATRTEGARSLFELIPNIIARRKPPLGIDRYCYALSALGVWFIAFPRAGAKAGALARLF